MDELSSYEVKTENNLGYLKKLLSLVAKKKADSKVLTYDEIEMLSDEDLENISDKFLEYNSYIVETLNKGDELKTVENKKTDYLNKLLEEYIKNEKKEIEEFLKQQNPFKDLLKNKQKFDNLFSTNYSISKHLEDGIKAISSIPRDTTDYSELLKPPPHPSIETNSKIQIIIEQINGFRPVIVRGQSK